MSDIKFKCESCGQPIVVDSQNAGRKLACPGCKTQLTVPNAQPEPSEKPSALKLAPPAGQDAVSREVVPAVKAPPQEQPPAKVEPAVPPKPVAKAPPPDGPAAVAGATATPAPVRVPTPAPVPVPTPKTPPPPPAEPPRATAAPTPQPPTPESAAQPVQMGILTAETKRDAIRGARELIEDPARWMPGVGQRDEGRLAYAAAQVRGSLTRVEVGSDEATHHSLLGAVLSGLHRLNVTPTAKGRVEFLDKEIPEALWKVIQRGAGGKPVGKTPDSTDSRLMSATHAQCLEALDLLEQQYAGEIQHPAGPTSLPGASGSSLEELMVRAARDEVVTTTELLRSVHRGMQELGARLAELEKRSNVGVASTGPSST